MLNTGADLDIIRLHRGAKDATLYLDRAFERIRAMAERHGSASAPFLDELWKLYGQRSPALGLWAGVDKTGGLVGHMLATVQVWDYEYVGWVNQIEFDVPLSQSAWDKGLAELDAWLAEVNTGLQPGQQVKRFMMTTVHNPKIFERRAGFRVARTIMERPLAKRA